MKSTHYVGLLSPEIFDLFDYLCKQRKSDRKRHEKTGDMYIKAIAHKSIPLLILGGKFT